MNNAPLYYILLFHYHTTPKPYAEHDPKHASSAAVRMFRNQLIQDNLIEPAEIVNHKITTGPNIRQTPGIFVSTDRGKAMVKHICNLPLPSIHTEWRVE